MSETGTVMEEELIREDTLYWIEAEQIKNEKGIVMTFDDHFFLIDIYKDNSKEIVVRKPAQIGISTWAILRTLHDARYWGINQIHTLPRAEDVQKFVPSKVNEIIKNNPSLGDKISEKETKAIGQKQFGKGFMFYKGTKSEGESIMLTSDRNVYDEYDRSDMGNIKNYHSRLEGIGSLKEEWYISTPTIPEYGVDAVWLESDQKHWRFDCEECGERQHMEWPDNVDFKRECYICSHCGEKLEKEWIRKGAWEARYPGREISGYWINQMIVPWIDAKDLIKYWKKAEEGMNDEITMEYFFNFKLGMPYMMSDTKMQASLIYANIKKGEVVELGSFMGVDVQGDELYVIIGNKDAVYVIARVPDTENKTKWERLAELVDVYDVRTGVIDAGYKPNDVKDFAEKFKGRIYMNWYQATPKGGHIIRSEKIGGSFTSKTKDLTFEEEIKVLTDRERAIDMMVTRLKTGNFPRFNFSKEDENLQMLIKHMKTMYVRIIQKKENGEKKREWANTGKNDLVHALVYFMVALHINGVYTEE